MPRSERQQAAPGTPAPRFATGWAALVYAIATLSLAYPALSGQFLVNPRSDQYIAGYAFREYAAHSLRSGAGIPQWNPFIFGGMPYVAAMHGDIFYPTALLRAIVGTDVGMTWGFAIHLFLAGLFTYCFLRAWGMGFIESLVGGLAYMLSGPIASYASPGHDGKLFVSALLPLALWQLVRGMRDGRNWAWGAFAITIGLAVLSPHPQLLQYLLLTSGAFTLFLAFGPDANGVKLERRVAIRRMSFALGAVVLGMAIGAIQYLPVREYVPWSPRANGKDYAYATSYSFPIIELFNTYLPQFTGMLDKYWGENTIHLHSEYIGGPVLLLAALAFGGDERKSFRRFWIGTAVVSFLWMLGKNTPFFLLIYNLVPGTKYFRAPSTIIYVFALSLSILAALGTEKLLARRINLRVTLGVAAAGLLLSLAALGGMDSFFVHSSAQPFAEAVARQNGYPESAIPQLLDIIAKGNHDAVQAGALRSVLFLLAAAGLALLCLRGKVPARIAGIALVAITAVDLWSIARNYWLFSPPARTLFATDPAIEYLKKDKNAGRVLVLANPDSNLHSPDPYYGTDGLGRGTGLWIHGIRSVMGYHGNELGRYDELSQYRIVEAASPAFLSPMFWRHENVNYLYTNKPSADSILTLAVGPVRNSAGSVVYLYRINGNRPYGWLAAAATRAKDSDALPAVIDPRFDPRRLAVYDSSAVELPPAPTAMPAPATVLVTTDSLSPGKASLTLESPAPPGASLIVSENYFPGWHAIVDGKERPAYRADFNLIGVPLPAGAKHVELWFHDDAVDKGKIVTMLAVLAALAALGAGIVTDRRRLA
jgi:hypothetical protein